MGAGVSGKMRGCCRARRERGIKKGREQLAEEAVNEKGE